LRGFCPISAIFKGSLQHYKIMENRNLMAAIADQIPKRPLMVVDDTPAALKATARVLEQAGYHVVQATGGRQALELIREHRPQLVLLDVVLPDLSGPEVLQQIRSDSALDSVSVVLLSSVKTAPDDQSLGLDTGADGYIARPITNQELLARVRSHLRQRELIDQLRASEERFRNVLNNQTDAVLVVDRNGKVLFHNPGAEQLLAQTGESLSGMNLGVPIAGSGSTEVQIQRADGRALTAEMRVSETRWENQPARIVVLRDITTRKARERLLLLQSSALEAATNGIIITDRNGIIEWVNAAFSRMSGYAREEALGQSPGELIQSGKQDAAFYRQLWEVIEAGNVWQGRIVNSRKDGTLYTEEMTITPVRDDAGEITHFIAIKQDISDRLALEEQLRRAQRMESIGQLSGGIAHDFNNLLTVVLGNAELLLHELSEDTELRELVEMITKGAQRGAELTQRLLAFARKQALDPKSVDINRLLGDMEQLLRRSLGEHTEVEIIAKDGLWPALIDPGQLEDAILNLALNARDAMPAGGCLTIETANSVLDEEYARDNIEVDPGDYVLLAVSDTGCGIPAEQLEQVFEPFFTTKRTGSNSGLGLAMVYGFVKQSRGHLKLYSEPGQGTTVKMYLPYARDASDTTGGLAAVTEHAGGDETILVVEDDALVRDYAEAQLTLLGYRVTTAANAEYALAVLRERDDIDLLFTDIILPGGMNGKELADSAMTIRPALNVLYTSGYTENAIVHHGRLDSGVPFLSKPYGRLQLAAKIRQVLGSQGRTDDATES